MSVTTSDPLNQNRLASQYLDLAKAKSRELGKELKRCGLTVDFDELESDANLFLAQAVQKFEESECKRTAGYFKRGLAMWARNQKQNWMRDHNSAAALHLEPLPDSYDKEVDDFDWVAQDEEEEVLIAQAGEDEVCGEQLQELVRDVFRRGTAACDDFRKRYGKNRYYRVVLPALADLLGMDLKELREAQ